jgi:hypothetical protein
MMTSANASFPRLFTEIDELSRRDHSHLTVEDKCFFLGEYASRANWDHSTTNKLILNFKKPMERLNRPEWPYKGKAIREAALAMKSALSDSAIRNMTFVPVPPSKMTTDPHYDDRMCQMLRLISPTIDIRELVVQVRNREAAHAIGNTRRPDEVMACYSINEIVAKPEPSVILICDDVLVTGCQYRAMRTKLGARFPRAKFFGMFLARRVPLQVDPSGLIEAAEDD